MNVDFPKKLIEQFKRSAKKRFPIEDFAFILGTRLNSKLVVKYLWFPHDREQHTTDEAVFTPVHWITGVKQIALDRGLEVLGDIHSHCFEDRMDCIPSEHDLDHPEIMEFLSEGEESFQAICTVWKTPKTKRAAIRLWPIFKKIKTKLT